MHTHNNNPLIINKRVIYAVLLREAKSRFGEYKLNMLWLFFEPVLQVSVMFVCLGLISKHVMPNVDYLVYVSTGIVNWLMFRSVFSKGATGIESYKSLFIFPQVNHFNVFIGLVFFEFLIYFVIYVAVLLFLIYLGHKLVFIYPLEFIACYVCLFLIGSAMGLITFVISFRYKDIRKFMGIFLRCLYLASGIVFPINKFIPCKYKPLLMWNPLLHIMEITRKAIFPAFNSIAGSSNLLYVFKFTVIMVFCGLLGLSLIKNRLFKQ